MFKLGKSTVIQVMGSTFLLVENTLGAYCFAKQAEKSQLRIRQHCCEEYVLHFSFFFLKATREIKFLSNNGCQS